MKDQTFKRARRRGQVSLPPAQVKTFVAPVTGMTRFGNSVVAQLQNQARVGFMMHVIDRRVGKLDQNGNLTGEHSTWEVLVGSTSVRVEFGKYQQAVDYARKALAERDYGGVLRLEDADDAQTVDGQKGGPWVSQLVVRLNRDGKAAVIDTLSGTAVVGILPDVHQPLLKWAIGEGMCFKAIPQLGFGDESPLKVTVALL